MFLETLGSRFLLASMACRNPSSFDRTASTLASASSFSSLLLVSSPISRAAAASLSSRQVVFSQVYSLSHSFSSSWILVSLSVNRLVYLVSHRHVTTDCRDFFFLSYRKIRWTVRHFLKALPRHAVLLLSAKVFSSAASRKVRKASPLHLAK